MVKIGDKNEIITKVEKPYLASSMKSGCLDVFATPMVVAFMEETALELLEPSLHDGITTVGTEVNVRHISPTPLGAEVRFTAELVESDDRFFSFKVEAYDKAGLIAEGTHTRASVKAEKFEKKANEKYDEI